MQKKKSIISNKIPARDLIGTEKIAVLPQFTTWHLPRSGVTIPVYFSL